MPIFRSDGTQLVSLTRVSPGPDLYEKEIEQHLLTFVEPSNRRPTGCSAMSWPPTSHKWTGDTTGPLARQWTSVLLHRQSSVG